MPVSRTIRKSISDRACLECQKRKTRCIAGAEGSGQPCAFCTRSGRPCVFESPQQRTPLTRRNLDEAEERCRQLEALLQRAGHGGGPAEVSPSSRVEHMDRPNNADATPAPYEWSEALDSGDRDRSSDDEHARDGMAALTDRGHGSGYLGTSSSHGILQSVSSLLPSQPEPVRQEARAIAPATPVSSSSQVVGAAPTWSASLSASFIQEQLINAYFLGYNSYYPILHEASFRRQLAARKEISARSTWHVTFYAVLAIGEWVSGLRSEDTSLYYEAARSRLIPAGLESGSINSVQAFLLLGNYLQKRDRPNTGYNFIGIALRMAMGLGLHSESASASSHSVFEQHRRRVLFWLLYCFDCWFNITTGRPALLTDTLFDIRIPSNVDESQCDATSGAVVEVTCASTCSAAIALARLTKIANRAYTQFMCAPTGPDIDHQATIMEHMIHNWRASLPPYFLDPAAPSWFLGPRQVVFWKESNLLILLLLSSQKHHQDEHEKLAIGARCKSASASAIADISSFCRDHADLIHNGLGWYAVYFILQATLSFTAQHIYTRRPSPEEPAEFLRSYEQTTAEACQCLQNLANLSRAATRSLRVITRLREMVRQSAGIRGSTAAMTAATTAEQARNRAGGEPTTLLSSIITPGQNQGLRQVHLDYFGFGTPEDNQTLPELVLGEWGVAADPSLHAFFTGMEDVGNGTIFSSEDFSGAV